MGLTDLLKSVSDKDDRTTAEVLAAFINADAFARQQLAGRSALNGTDVLRLGRVLTEYADLPPAPDSAETFRKPSAPANIRPAAPGPSVEAA